MHMKAKDLVAREVIAIGNRAIAKLEARSRSSSTNNSSCGTWYAHGDNVAVVVDMALDDPA